MNNIFFKFITLIFVFLNFKCTNREVVTPSVIPTKMSFEGTNGSDNIIFIDGEDDVKFKNEYIPCCSIFRTEIYTKNNYGTTLSFLVSQTESGLQTDKTYQDIVKNVFVKGYNKIGLWQIQNRSWVQTV